MGLDVRQFRDDVIVPALDVLARAAGLEGRINHPAAVELLLGTAACESRFQYLRQVGGPALGLYQMETPTYADVCERLRHFCPLIDQCIGVHAGIVYDGRVPSRLIYDLRYATWMARLLYWLRPEPLPAAGDIDGQGRYYKQWYNSSLGKGSRSRYVRHWQELVGPELSA